MESDSPITKRSPDARVSYVEGFVAGWREAAHVARPASSHAASFYDTAMKRELNDRLDVMSAVENAIREAKADE